MIIGGRGPRLVRLLRDGRTDVDFIPDLRHFPFRDIVAIVPLADGRVFVCGREGPPRPPTGPFDPSHLRLLRLKPTGEVDFAHYVPLRLGDEPRNFIVAGVLLDLLREAGGPGVVDIDQPLFRELESSPFDRLQFALNSSGRVHLGASEAYVRASGAGAGFDPAPVMTAQPVIAAINLALNDSRLFTAQPAGLFPLRYEWRQNGVPIAGATATTFPLRNVEPASAGDYTLAGINAHGTVVSNPIRVTVDSNRRAPTFIRPPSAPPVSVGDTAIVSVEATGSPAPIYAWSFHGIPIPGAIDATLRLPNVQPAQAGNYSVSVSVFGSGSFGSSFANLVVLNPLTGVWFGRLGLSGSDGDVALATKADRSLVALAWLRGTRSALVATAERLGTDGAFAATGFTTSAGDSMARTISGTINPATGATGQIAALGLPFTAALAAAANPASPFSGYYLLRTVLAENAEAHLIVATDGRVFALLRGNSATDSGAATVEATGRFAVPLASGAVFTGTLEPSGSATASIDRGASAGKSFAGLRDDLPRTDRLANLATRGWAGTGAEELIAGFVSTSAAPDGFAGARSMLVRAIGPSLAEFGVQNALSDPLLSVNAMREGSVSGAGGSDDWCLESGAAGVAIAAQNRGAFPLRNSRDAAFSFQAGSGNYSAHVSPSRGPPGIALVEIYDSSVGEFTPTSPRLINLSTRGRVDPGDGALFAGFVVTGNAPKRLLIRGVGPALENFGVAGTLADPVLTLFRESAIVLENDDWGSAAESSRELASAAAAAGAFPLPGASRDSSLLVTVPPGAYSARVSGKNGSRGIALVEIYEVPW